MKLHVAFLAGTFSLTACQTTHSGSSVKFDESDSESRNIKKAVCKDESGKRTLTIELSDHELPFPTYHVELKFKNKTVTKVTDALVAEDSHSGLTVEKTTDIGDRTDILVSAGLRFSGSKTVGFYQESANGGASPLPGLELSSCSVESQSTDSSDSDDDSDTDTDAHAGQSHDINSMTCTDSSGDRKLNIKRSMNELPFPSFHIETLFRGESVVVVTDALVKNDSKESFLVEKTVDIEDRKNILVSAGIDWSEKGASGFYQEAANGGASPLPAIFYDSCVEDKK